MKVKLHRGAFLRAAIIVVFSMFALTAHAQGGFGGGGGGGGGGRGGPSVTLPDGWELFALDERDLDLTRQQKRLLRDICDQYDDDVEELIGRRATQVTPEQLVRIAEFRTAANISVESILTEEQLDIRDEIIATRAAEEAARGRGGPGRGGGPGGFGGGRGGA